VSKNRLEVCHAEVPVVVPAEVQVLPQETIMALFTDEKMRPVQHLITKTPRISSNQSVKKRLLIKRRKSLSPWVVAGSIRLNWKKRRSHPSQLPLRRRSRERNL
jgi:hypothetical protein